MNTATVIVETHRLKMISVCQSFQNIFAQLGGSRFRKGTLFTFLLLFIGSFGAFAQVNKYVKPGGTGNGDTWDTPYGSIYTALLNGANNIYVAAGTYSQTAAPIISATPANVPNGNGSNANPLPDRNLLIQGGFPASATGTDISGYSASNVTNIFGNGLQVFSMVGYTKILKIKGFTIAEAYAISGSVFAAASVTNSAVQLAFEDLKITNNYHTNGAFFFTTVTSVKVDFKNCQFISNSGFDGGAIHVTTGNNSNYTIDGCAFNNNNATANGGAFYVTTGPLLFLIKNSSFCNNNSAFYGGALYLTTASAQIDNCTFNNNAASMFYWGGAIFATTSSVAATNSTFYGNHAASGGAIYQTTARLGTDVTTWNNCKFAYNYATQSIADGAHGGGAIKVEGGNVKYTVNNSVFYRNSTVGGSNGGAINHYGSQCTSMDGTIFLENRVGSSSIVKGADVNIYDNINMFPNIKNSTMQLASAATYTNQVASNGFTFGTGNTFGNTTVDGGAAALTSTSCPANIVFMGGAMAAVTNTGIGTIDCSKTQISPAPVAGTASQGDLIVSINVTTAGTFTPLLVSGSGFSLANGVNSVTATSTGIQTFHIPVKYDGTALGILNFTVGTLTACTADMTKAPKNAITSVWTLDCISTTGPGLK